MNIALTSDFHGYLPEIPECDLLIIGGDVCPVTSHDRKFQADWLRGEFANWLDAQPATETVWIGGNHDFVLEDWRNKRHKITVNGLYLDNEAVTTMGLKIWGSPLANKFGNWAFMAEEDVLKREWEKIPRDIDILVVHGPVWGYGDLVPAVSWSAEKRGWKGLDHGQHVGSISLYNQLAYDEWPNLKLVISGHIHEAYGTYKMGDVDVYSVSHVTGAYEPINPVMEYDWMDR